MAKRTLDFSNVKEQAEFRPTHVEEGDYTATVTKFTETTKKDDSSKQMWVFTVVLDNKPNGGRYPYYCTLNEEALWKVRNLLVACGFKVPKKRMAVDPEKVVGRKIGVHMVDDEYNGQMKSVIDAIFPVGEAEEDTGRDDTDDSDDDDEEDEEPPAKPAKKSKKKAPEPEPEEDDEEDDDEEDEEEPPPPPKKSAKKGKKKPPPPEDDEDDEDDDLEVDDDDL